MLQFFNPLWNSRFQKRNTSTARHLEQNMVCKRSLIICTFCVLFRSEEERKEICCCMEAIGTVFMVKNSMGSNSGTIRVERQHEISHGDIFQVNKLRLWYYNTLTSFKKDMATITATWKVVYLLGSLILGSSYLMAAKIRLLDIDFGSAPEGFKYTMYALSCIALTVMIGRGIVALVYGWHKAREQKIKADTMQEKFNAEYHPSKKTKG